MLVGIGAPLPRLRTPDISEDLQGGSVFPVVMRLYHDLDILIERHQEAQKALNGKLPEFSPQHFGNVGLANAKQLCGLNLFETALFQDRIDLEYKLRLNEVLLRIRHADVLEHIAAPEFMSLFADSLVSLAICSASRSRRLIISRPRRDVSLPVFDFFWKACRT
jgi:hypothetical protein